MIKKKHIWFIGIIGALVFLSIPTIHLVNTRWNETSSEPVTKAGYANDASYLNETLIDTIVDVTTEPIQLIEELLALLRYAQSNQLKISIAGARHSMGGHTITPNGIVVNMLPYNHMELDSSENILTIGAGALWSDAIHYLESFGKSIAIMQAFSSFSIGGSLSVNGHGWQKNLPPLSSSVIAFTLLKADGDVLVCSPTQNSELFSAVLGGYGLFGIILDVKLSVVDNLALEYKYVNMSTENYLKHYEERVTNNPKTELVFGRLRISNKRFLEEATLNYFERTNQTPPPLAIDNSLETKRLVFRGSVDSEYGKRLRWDLESSANKMAKNTIYSRNQLLNDDVSLIENKDTTSTDILHEYFIPEANFDQFIQDMKPILKDSEIDLLNITIRRVETDTVTLLAYAREPVYGFVILFNQKKTAEQEQAMKTLTNQLVDAAAQNNGTYYLPYRLHISKEKMRTIYPKADHFFELKATHDPNTIFSNKFFEHYR